MGFMAAESGKPPSCLSLGNDWLRCHVEPQGTAGFVGQEASDVINFWIPLTHGRNAKLRSSSVFHMEKGSRRGPRVASGLTVEYDLVVL